MKYILSLIFIFFGYLGVYNTLSIIRYTNLNLGTVLPGIIGLLFIVWGIFRVKIISLTSVGYLKVIRLTFTFGALCIILSFFIICIVIQSYSKNIPKPNQDAIIVLGAGLRGENLSSTLQARLNRALQYHNQNPNSIIIVSGGQGPDELVTEASAMKKYLLQKGIAEDKILYEDRSTSTKENFKFSKVILDNYFNGKDYSIVFVTNDFHLLRSKYYAVDAGFKADGLPSPSLKYLLPNYYLREYLALSWYYVVENFIK